MNCLIALCWAVVVIVAISAIAWWLEKNGYIGGGPGVE
jgi:hypothetical protein